MDIQGKSDRVPPSYITFDDPHLPAGTPLVGQYPSGVIDWGKGEWQIGTPYGKFGTFTLALADPKAPHAEFHFYDAANFCRRGCLQRWRQRCDDHYSFARKSRSVFYHQAQRASPPKDRLARRKLLACPSTSPTAKRCASTTWLTFALESARVWSAAALLPLF